MFQRVVVPPTALVWVYKVDLVRLYLCSLRNANINLSLHLGRPGRCHLHALKFFVSPTHNGVISSTNKTTIMLLPVGVPDRANVGCT